MAQLPTEDLAELERTCMRLGKATSALRQLPMRTDYATLTALIGGSNGAFLGSVAVKTAPRRQQGN